MFGKNMLLVCPFWGTLRSWSDVSVGGEGGCFGGVRATQSDVRVVEVDAWFFWTDLGNQESIILEKKNVYESIDSL